MTEPASEPRPRIEFYGGVVGLLTPLFIFLEGVAFLGLSGTPDERGFWPVLLVAIAAGTVLAKDRKAYGEAVLDSMSQRLVLLMVMAWMLAGVLGSLVGAGGFVEALVAVAGRAGVSGGGYAVAAFFICAGVSTATGTSLGTVILCAPLLYPAGGPLGADPVVLIAAILGGATFGDNISPVSDTTIASAGTQDADLGGVVRSRLPYAIPAAVIATVLFFLMGSGEASAPGNAPGGSLLPLVLVAGPAVALGLLLRRKPLIEGLVFGIITVVVVGLLSGTLALSELMYLDRENFIARGLLLEGMERAIGVSFFTILLMGMIGGLQQGGILDALDERLRRRTPGPATAEWWAFGATSVATFLTTHSVVAILSVGDFVRKAGEAAGVSSYRRSNILDVTVCTYPFLLPFFIPTILASAMTIGAEEFGMPRVSPLEAGLFNFHSWALLAVLLFALSTGYGRRQGAAE